MAKPKKQNTAAAVRELALPVAKELGLSLWDVQFVKEGPDWFLRLIIDKPGGIDIEDCERMSRAVDPLIDELDPSEHEYFLEVSSPGIGRQLKTDDHLSAYVSKDVFVKMIRPEENGQREFLGELVSFSPESVTIKTKDGEAVLARKSAAFIKAGDDDILGGTES